MKLDEFGVGKITAQNTTKDVKPGETERQAKKLGLLTGKTKLLHKTAAKNSTPNKLFNLGITEDIEDSANDWLSMMFDNKDIDTILNAPKEFKQAPSTSKIYRAIFKDRNVQKENAKSTAKFIPYSTSTAGAHTYVDMSDNPGPYVIVEKQFNPNDMLVNFQSIVEHYDLLIPQNWEDEVWMKRTPYLTQSSKEEIVFDSEGNESLTEGYSKDMDEEWFKKNITAIAKKYKIDPKVALDVWRSEGGMSWQSKFKPKGNKVKTVGGQEASWGPFQLYTGKGGLGSAWEKEFGKKLSKSTSKADVLSQIDFALKTVPNRGWQDFKGANRVGIKQYQGVPNKNNPMYNNLPISKPTDVKKSSDMYNKMDKIKTQPSILDPRPLAKTIVKNIDLDPRPLGQAIKKGATDLYRQSKKELGNIEVDKDSFTYKNIVKPASDAYDYISKGYTNWKKDIQNSPEYKAAGERNKKLWGTKPAQVKELKIQKPDPKDTLGKKRKDMPQIKKQDYEEFMDYLKSNGAKFSKETVPASELKAMQSEFSDAGIIKQLEKNIDQGINSKAVIISDDDFVLDGHHRWLVAMNTGNDINVYRINLPAHKLFDLTNGFEKTYYKGMYETPGTINVPMASGLTVSIFPHRPLKIKKSTKGKLNYNEGISQVDLDTVEVFADRLFSKVGIDVEFTRHFLDRVNDKRNGQPISVAELTRLFKQEYKRYGKPIAQMGPDQEAVMKDLQTNLNLPFALQYDKENNELDLVAKTIMRKDDFKTPNKVFAVEAFNNPYPIDWGGSDDPESERWVGTSKLEDGSELTLEIASFDPGQYQIDFYRQDKTNVQTMKATGQGDEFRVFATVQKGILEWWESIDQDEVSRITFSASKESDDSKNRHKLYGRFAKQWANKIGWTATTGQEDDAVNFVLIRPNAAKFAKDQDLEVMEDLRDWFKQKWVNIGKKKKGGGYADCGTSGDKKGYAKCVPAKKAASMTKKEKESAVRRKRAAQNKKGRGGKKKAGSGKKPIRVKTKSDAINTGNPVFEAWSQKYKKSIDCSNPKGFSQKAHCAGRKKKNEEAPPGREKQVKKLKKKFDDPGAPYAIAWAQHNKHGKPKKEGKLNYNEDLNTQRGRLEYYLKQPSIKKGMAIHLGKLPKYHNGKDELAELVPERNGIYALNPDAWEGTFYSLTNKDLKKISFYQPAIVKIPQGSIVADMAIANQFYRTNNPEEKEKFAKAYKDSIVPYGSDTSHIKMPEIIMPSLVESLEEGVNDPHIFKAVFMAGGPGSGKSFVAKNLLGGTGLRPVNSDEVYEFLLKRQGLTLGPDDIASDKGQEIRGTAKNLTDKRQTNYIDGRLGLIIDGTGKVPELIQKLASQLKSIGYSVSMIFVNTSLEVAQQRNLERERTLPKDIVAKSWNEVQQNLMKYQQIFGADKFHIIDNSGGLEDLDRTKNFDKVYNEVQRFINTPPKHQKALEWIQNQKAQNNARQTNSGKPDGGVTNPN